MKYSKQFMVLALLAGFQAYATETEVTTEVAETTTEQATTLELTTTEFTAISLQDAIALTSNDELTEGATFEFEGTTYTIITTEFADVTTTDVEDAAETTTEEVTAA